MAEGYWCPVLHAHLPYVRHPEYPQFLEEDWFFEALTETYVPIVSVLDGHPATLAWLGAVAGHRVRPLGVEHFGQTGSLADLYRHYGIDANAIVAAAQAIAPGRPIRHLKALP